MTHTNLRQLSRQYARGAIDRAEYQRRRAELIDSILASIARDGPSPAPDLDDADTDERPRSDRRER